MIPNEQNSERILTAVLLLIVVALQLLAAVSTAIRVSAGHTGRLFYYIAFACNLIHDLFSALVVPITLIYTASQLLHSERATETVLVAIVATLWYSPERVQSAIANLLGFNTRLRILIAALGYYHRAAVDWDEDDMSLDPTRPLTVCRRLRFWPWWSRTERHGTEYWNGRVVGAQVNGKRAVRLADGQLRAVARDGVHMALLGGFSESELRAWCAAIVADQARFENSRLEGGEEYPNMKVYSGLEGQMIRKSFVDYGKDWSDAEMRRLAYIANGIRGKGLAFIRKEGWVQ